MENKSYTPKDQELVYSISPKNYTDKILTFVIRKATRADKIKFILKMRKEIEDPNYELEKEALRNFFKKDIFLCIQNENITCISPEFIVEPYQENNSNK